MTFTSLQDAVRHGQSMADPVQYAVEAGCLDELFDSGSGARWTLLHQMVALKSARGVDLLLRKGASPNVTDSDGVTPLVEAVMLKEPDIVRLLVEAGADVDAREPRHGDSALHAALIQGRPDIAQILLDHGADPDASNDLDITPRHIEAFKLLRGVAPR